jgi:hypothetical protein
VCTGNAERVAAEILAYLYEHPNAADTMEGIADWWLPQQRLTENLTLIHAALRLLLARGLIHKRRLPDGQTIYRVHGSREDANER